MLCRLHGNRSIMSSRVSRFKTSSSLSSQAVHSYLQPWFYICHLCVARTYVAHGLAVLCCKGKAVRLLVSKIAIRGRSCSMNASVMHAACEGRPYETSLVAEWFKNSHPSEII